MPVLWVPAGALSAEPSRSTVHELLSHAGPAGAHRARPRLAAAALGRPGQRLPEVVRALGQATLAIGNRAECEIAVGHDRAATRRPTGCWPSGSHAAIVKLGGDGVLVATADGRREQVAARTRSRWCAGWARATPSGARSATACCRVGTSSSAPRYGNAAGAIVAGRLMCADDMPTFGDLEDLVGERHAAGR